MCCLHESDNTISLNSLVHNVYNVIIGWWSKSRKNKTLLASKGWNIFVVGHFFMWVKWVHCHILESVWKIKAPCNHEYQCKKTPLEDHGKSQVSSFNLSFSQSQQHRDHFTSCKTQYTKWTAHSSLHLWVNIAEIHKGQ